MHGDIPLSRRLRLQEGILRIPNLLLYSPGNEPSGSVIADYANPSSGIVGTLTNGVANNPAGIGRSIKYNGTNAKLSFGNVLLSNTVVSVFFRLKILTGSTNNQETILGYGNTRWFFIFGDTTTNFRFTVVAPTEKSSGNTTFGPTIGKWYSVVGTYDPNGGSNNIVQYVYNSTGTLKEKLSNTITGAMNSTAQPLEIGHDPARNFFVNVQVNHFAVANTVLSQNQANELAKLAAFSEQ